MKKTKVLTALLLLLIFATLAFIWVNSLRSIPESRAESESVLKVVKPFLEVFVGTGNVTDHLVRKLAHYTEFFALGCELCLLLTVKKRVDFQGVCNCFFVGLIAAVTDESLQLISQRGSQVIDILLDYCGVASGILILLLIFAIIKPKKRYRS